MPRPKASNIQPRMRAKRSTGRERNAAKKIAPMIKRNRTVIVIGDDADDDTRKQAERFKKSSR